MYDNPTKSNKTGLRERKYTNDVLVVKWGRKAYSIEYGKD